MKNITKLPMYILCLTVLVACSSDSASEKLGPVFSGGNPESVPSFDFLWLSGFKSNTLIDMPIENSPTNLIVGRWKVTKLGVDHNNDGKVTYFNYQDFEHKNCGLSFLQFNNDGEVFENSYYKYNGICNFQSVLLRWDFIDSNRLKIDLFDNIYVIGVTQSELILKQDMRYENSIYAPTQFYYYFERIP